MRKHVEQNPNGNGQSAHLNQQSAGLPPQTPLGPLWTRKQVADALGLCIHSIARYTRAGLLPCIRLNRRVVRYDPSAVQAFINSASEGVR